MGSIAVVLKGYPRLSETFIAQELLALERRGLDLRLFSMRRPTDRETHPIHGEIEAPVVYLPEYARAEPGRVARALAAARRLPGFGAAAGVFRRDLARDRSRGRMRRFAQAAVLAAEAPAAVAAVYAHFLHTPASVGRYAALMRGLPFAVSAHAKDIWTIPDWEKREKLAAAVFATTCAAANHAHLERIVPGRTALIHHGLDFRRFPAAPAARTGEGPARLLTVARPAPKKGLDGLLRALAALPADCDWRWTHIGGGDGRAGLQAQADALGIADRIVWRGALAQAAVLEAYRDADVFVLPSRVASDGDRDGLPNVLMEAQSQGLCCVSTDAAGAPELITPDETGLIVPADDAPALTAALARLIADPALRARLGAAGADRVRAAFDHEAGADRIAAGLRAAIGAVA